MLGRRFQFRRRRSRRAGRSATVIRRYFRRAGPCVMSRLPKH